MNGHVDTSNRAGEEDTSEAPQPYERSAFSETTWSSPSFVSSGADEENDQDANDGADNNDTNNNVSSTGSTLGHPNGEGRQEWKHVIRPILQKMLRIFGRNFVLAYNVRAGIAIAGRLFTVLRKWFSTGGISLTLEGLVSEAHVHVRVSAFRWALFIASFSSSYFAVREILLHALQRLGQYWTENGLGRKFCSILGSESEENAIQRVRVASSAAALCSSGSLFWLDKESRRTISLYAMARALQTLYNVSKNRGFVWHWRPLRDAAHLEPEYNVQHGDWLGGHGDLLLFSLGSAQVMYAFIVHGGALPPSYEKFILKTGPIRTPVLNAVRNLMQHGSVKTQEILEYCLKNRPDWLQVFGRNGSFDWWYEIRRGFWVLLRAFGFPITLTAINAPSKVDESQIPWPSEGGWSKMNLIPSSVAHPRQSILIFQWIHTFVDAARRVLAIYSALNFVPPLVLRLRYVSQRPGKWLKDAFLGTVRSTTFLGVFVAMYMAVFDIHRLYATRENRAVYAVGGFIAGTSLLIERKSKRAELALYVLPRAIDALWKILKKRRLLESVPYGEGLLFAASLAVLLSSTEVEGDTVSAPVRWTIQRFIPTHPEMVE
eukprot:gb/GECG01012806.1/.p1 GENE.gb/GECG01012806.1/~~gb/GECG01012806.1/.p1  ORF type:complete len:602 (+),score=54.48 gb/GECG01012806.1/:1-1806(+)